MLDDFWERVTVKTEVVLEYDGKKLLDLETANLLEAIDSYGSILTAAKSLGLPYSKAWEKISKVEKILGEKIVERKRGGSGGGGTTLTKDGKRLLEYYKQIVASHGPGNYQIAAKPIEAENSYLVTGSHDIVLELLLGELRRRQGFKVDVHWIGSSGGLASLMLGDSVLASTHLYDPKTGKYNIPFLQNYWLDARGVVIRGYQRELVIAFPRRAGFGSLEEILASILQGRVKIVNRNLGSGTRVIFDYVLAKKCSDLGREWSQCLGAIKGYSDEVNTHIAVAKRIVSGKADVGVTLRCVSDFYRLESIHLVWEFFDFVTLKNLVGSRFVRSFISLVSSEKLGDMLGRFSGYRLHRDTGEIIYP